MARAAVITKYPVHEKSLNFAKYRVHGQPGMKLHVLPLLIKNLKTGTNICVHCFLQVHPWPISLSTEKVFALLIRDSLIKLPVLIKCCVQY